MYVLTVDSQCAFFCWITVCHWIKATRLKTKIGVEIGKKAKKPCSTSWTKLRSLTQQKMCSDSHSLRKVSKSSTEWLYAHLYISTLLFLTITSGQHVCETLRFFCNETLICIQSTFRSKKKVCTCNPQLFLEMVYLKKRTFLSMF